MANGLIDGRGRWPRTPAPVRFWRNVIKRENACWEWLGHIRSNGYAQFHEGTYAHRYSYILHKGPIPKGLQIDHLCRNRGCVNPEHLEAVTPSENTRRGNHYGRNKTHCSHGHAFDLENTRVTRNGRRQCRRCSSERKKRYYQRAKNGN